MWIVLRDWFLNMVFWFLFDRRVRDE